MNPCVPGYSIQREIGKGGMGMVYRATRDADGMTVALKILPPNLLNPISAKRFQREGSALKSIDHPNVVKVYEVGSRDGLHFIAMEFIEGKPLSRLMREQQGALALERVAEIALDIAEALNVIHRKGMVHRDLKPGNILVTAAGEVKLLDFGLVQVEGLTMLTATGNVVGTPAYMSPEQCSGDPIDSRSDIYSFAILLYELLVGRPPFRSESVYELLEMQRNASPELPGALRKGVPANVEEIILRCLEKTPANRPASLDEAIAILTPLARARPSRCIPHAQAAPARPVAKPRRNHRGARAAILVAAAAGGLWLGFPSLQEFAKWCRNKAQAMQSQEDQGLREEISARYRTLAEAERRFSRAREEESRGNALAAWGEYLQAAQLFPDQPAYYLGLARTAVQAGKTRETMELVRAYLQRPGASDPEDLLQSWWKGQVSK